MLNLKRIVWIVYQEFRTTIRDHWTWVTAGMLMVLTLAISYFGLVRRVRPDCKTLMSLSPA